MHPAARHAVLRPILGFCLLSAAGCGGSAVPRAVAPEAPEEGAKCRIAASQQNPLVTEWPASEKANLEVQLHDGGAVVAYSGCEMRLLPQCHVPGHYAWQRTTPATDLIEIRSDDDLWAKLPLGAASLEGELKAAGRLAMQTTVAGQLRLTGAPSLDVPPTGVCAGATHVVGSLSVGAFQLRSGGALSGQAEASIAGVGGGKAGTSSSEVLVREAGRAEACRESSDAEPSPECRSPIQMFLWPLTSTLANRAPAGTVKTSFVTGDAETVWEIVSDDRVLCRTPCSTFVSSSSGLLLREKDPPFLRPASRITLAPLGDHGDDEAVTVRAHRTATGELGGGITLTALAGLATVTGIALTSIGCSGAKQSLCTPGLITLPIGLAALAPGIWLIVDSGAHAEVEVAGASLGAF